MAADAARSWSRALESWAIPAQILAAAPESPWTLPPAVFARSAELAVADSTGGPSRRKALEVLDAGATVLDVGVGGGAASLPLAPPAARLVGVDQSAEMLAAFARAADARGVEHVEVVGLWPEVADEVGPADVVVCHHVAYNVADLVPFAAALTSHARRRVVLELTAEHPRAHTRLLWRELHGIERPSRPVASDAVAVLEEVGLDVGVEEHAVPPLLWRGTPRSEIVALLRRQLCVGPERDAEIDALLGDGPDVVAREAVTLWWDGAA
ncbi:MAG: methyltransferase domain-containing protein [Actinobacteria bacterium]|nr:methyltransferase domain-containing protein [Actinomycetota bacterium]